MAFWSTQTLREKLKPNKPNSIIPGYQPGRIKYGAYELSLGGETIITPSSEQHATKSWKANEKVVIPPGQMAMLITEEHVNVPLDAMAFISMKAGKKLGGLINISGFHVDPGFKGKLKFSVFNAGSRDAVLEVGQPTFPIWFCNLDEPTDTEYHGVHQNQDRLTAEDASRLRGEVASPGALKKRIDELDRDFARRITECEHRLGFRRTVLLVLLGAAAGTFFGLTVARFDWGKPNGRDQAIRADVEPTSGKRPPVHEEHQSEVDRAGVEGDRGDEEVDTASIKEEE